MILDGNGHPIPLIDDQIPLAVTRFTTSLATAQEIVPALNAGTKILRCYADTYDAYIYFYGPTRTNTVSLSVFHRFVPAGQIMDYPVPAGTTKITGIAEGICPKFIAIEMAL